ncbi:DUF3313 domain-containing protein [Xanthomonas sp. NCPPB 2654]|uniref:DUF3313 domain-containing protein n=1 Tax=unclassified Xanthomonas TaxID=2643310 RepID=UPI0021DF4E46|nr:MULTISPECIES: DUF3313 domain-containing protein [unclassified Xanthomonas]MDL5364940.1 DUF3313 domain-containing protein [Xanthomonas sp. NCPPB 2654]MDR6674045.1 hypothetical protein [Xanthomonas translucens]MEB1527872.1 DUF3313 domain-containing protein [Xanthomonas campestris pv. campestris]UYC19411.1 DUF3313 domain-containing protein [Xanthomonas sp. CFBP 8443]
MKHSVWLSALALAISLGAAGCASTRPVAYAGLASSQQLRPTLGDRSGRVPYDYSAGADWRDYDSAVVAPVTIYRGPDNQFDQKVSEQDKAELADFMRAAFGDALQARFPLLDRPRPGSLRVAVTLTGAKKTPQVAGTVTKFDLAGGPYNVVQSIRGKEGALSGSVSYAVEIYDATNNRLLSAYVSKQYPNALNVKASIGGLGAAKAGIRKGAQELVARLD